MMVKELQQQQPVGQAGKWIEEVADDDDDDGCKASGVYWHPFDSEKVTFCFFFQCVVVSWTTTTTTKVFSEKRR
jgi:hypothetical protein